MIRKLLKHIYRALYHQKGYMLINVTGLSIGISCTLIIILFIHNELAYDQFHVNKDRIYRTVVHGSPGGQELNVAISSAALGPALFREFSELEDFARLTTPSEVVVKSKSRDYTENKFILADTSFFNIFSYPLVRGDKKKVLSSPHSLVISVSAAQRIFGNEDPVDKMLQVGNDEELYRITGVMADIPLHSHINVDLVGSFMTISEKFDSNWGENSFITYLLLKPKANPGQVNAKMPGLIRKYLGPLSKQALGITIDEFMAKNHYGYFIQPLRDFHLNQAVRQYTKPPINPKYLYIFGSIAIFIIVIAVINFMNLSTAQGSRRAKEVGIKKVSGSTKGMLIGQFITESLLLSFLSLGLAIIIIENTIPYFNHLLGAKLSLNFFENGYTIPFLAGLAIVVGVLAGIYPAFFLSSFNPYQVLKGKIRENMKNGWLRSFLVIIQFSISILLIVGTVIIYRQIQFMEKKDLGFNKEHLLVIKHAESIGNHVRTFKEAIIKIPEVLKVSASTQVPGHSESGQSYYLEGRPGEVFDFKISYVDFDFFETYGIKLSSGRVFSEQYPTDKEACIVNESTIKRLGIKHPLTARLIDSETKLPIVGVTRNFHFESLQHEINPYIFRVKDDNNNWGFISIRLTKGVTSSTMMKIEKVWKEYSPSEPFQYFFIDQDFNQKYKEEKQNVRLSFIFTILAIIIASLGLLGLTSITIEHRTKEIGVRKTMGASVTGIFVLIAKEFAILITLATLIAWPVIYFAAKNWLQNYFYRINMSPLDFLFGFLFSLFIALIIICYRTLKTARMNPVDALRYE